MGKIRVLCYGDSNTFGSRPDGLALRFSDEERWTGVLQHRLGPTYTVIVEGLGGRTTVWDDPIEPYRNGSAYLIPCLLSHAPLDLVILLLGTNDLKQRFSATAQDIANGAGRLVAMIQQSEAGRDARPPEVLLLAPAALGKLTELAEMFTGAAEKAPKLGKRFREVADFYGCEFLDLAPEIRSSDLDGIHLEMATHKQLGELVANKVMSMDVKT
jgi:lysophospholipase L1-like esterase